MSTESDAISEALVDAASGPKRVKGDAGEVETHPIADLIEADRYQRSKDAATSGRRGLRFTKIIPPGTLS
jgi:hypothetical protein